MKIENLSELEKCIILMKSHKVNSLKLNDIEIVITQHQYPTELAQPQNVLDKDDDLFWSAD